MRIQGVTLDVTDTHEVARRQRESDAAYRIVVETSVDAFVGMDGQGRINILERNSAAEKKTVRLAATEGLTRSLAEAIIPTAQQSAHVAAVERLRTVDIPDGSVFRREVDARHRDGRQFPVELGVIAVTDDPDGVLTAVRSAT